MLLAALLGAALLQLGAGMDTTSCDQYCTKTYSAHTNEESVSAKSCKQGCLAYAVFDYAKLKFDEKREPTEECATACGKAYSGEEAQKDACVAGCGHKKSFSETHQLSVSVESESPMYPMIKKLVEKIFGGFGGGFGDMMSRMFGGSNGEMATAENNDMDDFEKEFEMMRSRMMENMHRALLAQHEQLRQRSRLMQDLQQLEQQGHEVNNMGPDGGQIIRVHMIPVDRVVDGSRSHEASLMQNGAADPESEWLSFLVHRSRRLTVASRWLLFLSLLIAILLSAWASLALLRTVQRRRMQRMAEAGHGPTIYSMPIRGYMEKAAYGGGEKLDPNCVSDKLTLILCEETQSEVHPSYEGTPPPPYDPQQNAA